MQLSLQLRILGPGDQVFGDWTVAAVPKVGDRIEIGHGTGKGRWRVADLVWKFGSLGTHVVAYVEADHVF